MQVPTQTAHLQNQADFLEAVKTRNHKRLAEIWKVVQKQPNQKQAVLAFIDEIDDQEKVEWILNEIIVHSPVRSRHNTTLARTYLFSHMATEEIGGYIGLEKVMIKLGNNCLEPDLCFFRPEVSRRFKSNQTIFPVPDFIVEVLSPSTRERDMGVKRQLYCRYGVKEYWMVDAKAELVYQNILRGKIYKQSVYSSEMQLRSKVIKALELPVGALFDASHPFKTWVSSAIHGEVASALEASIELLKEQDKALKDKDKALKDKDKALKDKDKALEDKDKIIAQLRTQLDSKT